MSSSPFFDDEGKPTLSSEEQIKVETKVAKFLSSPIPFDERSAALLREEHVAYLEKGLFHLSGGFQSLDASRPWLVYWILHALELLDALPDTAVLDRVVDFLDCCQDKQRGGFAGGPGQLPHIAPTYASINALMICGTPKAYEIIDRQKLHEFLLSRKHTEELGAFTMHEDGETDVRGAYCAFSAASLVNILTPALIKGTPEYIGRCQTYEGGMGGEPFNEAHGGYTFCALAALILSGNTQTIDVDRLLYWAIHRQMPYEGGFQGRTNKLVDACYSFWQGAIFPLIDIILNGSDDKNNKTPPPESVQPNPTSNNNNNSNNINNDTKEDGSSWLFVQRKLQEYLLKCCQDLSGGLRDKPGKSRDYYHTCYALSGLAIAQHNRPSLPPTILGPQSNLLHRVHPVYNIGIDKVEKARLYFGAKPFSHAQQQQQQQPSL